MSEEGAAAAHSPTATTDADEDTGWIEGPDHISFVPDESSKYGLGYLRLAVKIPNLEVSKGWQLDRQSFLPRPKRLEQASNADVNLIKEDRGFILTVKGHSGPVTGKKYRLHVKKVLKPIVKDDTFYKVKPGRVLIFLKKEIEETWFPELHELGLDIHEDAVEDKNCEEKSD